MALQGTMRKVTEAGKGQGFRHLSHEVSTGLLERTGETGHKVSHKLHEMVMAGGEGSRRAADILHGTWLGHPLHPVLTDLTIGAWTLGAVFDLIGTASGDRRLERPADLLTAIGTASAIPTALAGLTDYSTIPKTSSKTATVHGLLNGAALGLYALSLSDRRRGRRGRGMALSALALGANMFSAWLGGHLVYRERVGVDHGERFDGPKEWRSVLPAHELAHGRARRVEVDGKAVMVYREGSEVYAIAAVCSHAGGPLEQGRIEGCRVQCPWHDSVFDLRDGAIVHGPATSPQAAFEARISGNQVEVRLVHGGNG